MSGKTISPLLKGTAVLSMLGLTLTACGEGNGDGEEAAGANGEITISLFSGWEEGMLATYLWESILEDEGYEVSIEESEAGPAYAGLADGSYDINLDAWLPVTHGDFWDDYGDELEDLGTWNDEVYLTIAVNEDAPIDSLDELAENADEFDNTIYGIEPGAGLTDQTEDEAIPEYELEDMEFITSSTPAMIAELDSHIESGENVVVTLWRPHWTYGAYPIRDLEDPEGAMGDEESMHIVARDGFSDDHSEVSEWLGDFEMDTETLTEALDFVFADEPDEDEVRDLVQEWMEDNQDYVDGLTG